MRWGAALLAAIASAACGLSVTGAELPTPTGDGGPGSDASLPPAPPPDDDATTSDVTSEDALTCPSVAKTFLDGFTPTRTFHVATSGNDGDVGNLAAPWRTIANSLAKLSPGDLLEVHAGAYGCLTIANVHGTNAAPIWIHSYDGVHAANLDCSRNTAGGLEVNVSSFVAVDGFIISNAIEDGVHVSGSDHVVLVNDEVTGGGTGNGVHFNSNTGSNVIDSCIVTTTTATPASGIIVVGDPGIRISRSYVHDTTSSGIHVSAAQSELYANRIERTQDGIVFDTGVTTGIAVDTVVYASRNGVVVNGGAGETILVANDTFVLTSASAAIVATGTPTVRAVDDAFDFEGAAPAAIFQMSTATVQQSHNLVYAAANANVASISSTPAAGGTGTLFDKPPQFANVGGGDVHPQSGSPLVGAGTPVFESGRDPDGVCRTIFDIGAY